MKPPAHGFTSSLKLQFFPFISEYIVGPGIIQIHIGHSLSSENNQIGIHELPTVVSSFPGSCQSFTRYYFSPNQCVQVENAERVKPLFSFRTAAENDDFIIDVVIVDGVIRARLWIGTFGF